MKRLKRFWRGLGLVLLGLALMVNGSGVVVAQVATTTVADTVYRANGTAAGGSVVVSWGAFTTAGGQAVPAGTTTVTIGAGGSLSVALAPNAGATPMGSYYTAVFHLDDGTTSREYWVVPVTVPGGGPATLAAIRNQVLPLSVAMQTVSKQYVDEAVARAEAMALSSGGSGSPTGSAGGDLSGTYPNPAVAAVHATTGTLDGVAVGATTPSTGAFTSMTATGLTLNGGGGGLAVTPLNVTSASTNATYFCVTNTSTGAHQYCNFSLGAANGPPILGVQDNTSNVVLSANGINPSGNVFYQVPSTGIFGFASGAAYDTYPDTGISRLSAGVVAFGNGSAGSAAATLKAATYIEALTTPASSSAACTAGQFTDDASYHYVCVAANTWKRAALSSF